MLDSSDDKLTIILSPEYDPSNPDHVARWERAGRPDLAELDGDGNHWRPTIPADLQSDGSYLPRVLPPSNPVTAMEIATQKFIEARRSATLFLDNLKGRVHVAMVESGDFTDATATTAGVAFVRWHSEAMTSFKDCGGHSDAASNLLAAIVDSVSQFPWLASNGNAILNIFIAALTY